MALTSPLFWRSLGMLGVAFQKIGVPFIETDSSGQRGSFANLIGCALHNSLPWFNVSTDCDLFPESWTLPHIDPMRMPIRRSDDKGPLGCGNDTGRWNQQERRGRTHRPVNRWIHARSQRAILVVSIEFDHHRPILTVERARNSSDLGRIRLARLRGNVECNGGSANHMAHIGFWYGNC